MYDWYGYIVAHPPLVLMVGDVFNLAGAVWLATDLILKEKELLKHDLYRRVLTRPHDFPIEVDGHPIEQDQDVDIVFVRRKARAAKWASVLLVIGFTLLAVGHGLELKQAKDEAPGGTAAGSAGHV